MHGDDGFCLNENNNNKKQTKQKQRQEDKSKQINHQLRKYIITTCRKNINHCTSTQNP